MAVDVTVRYPASLPCPVATNVQSAERRLLSELDGPRQSRPFSRDRLAAQPVEFFFTHEELAEFQAWGADDLSQWGGWFAADWPLPQGGVGVRRFIGAPSFPVYYHTVGWRVTAICQLRGRGELPVSVLPALLLLHFDGNLTDSAQGRSFSSFGDAGFSTENKVFGSAAYVQTASGVGRFMSDADDDLSLGTGEWQIEGFAYLATASAGVTRTILKLGSITPTGAGSMGQSGDFPQFWLTTEGSNNDLILFYADGTTQRTIATVASRSLPVAAWAHWAICGDAAGVRMYIAGVKVGEDPGYSLSPGPYTNQVFQFGAVYAGGGLPGVWAAHWRGGYDEIRIMRLVTYTGDTIEVPSAPFRAG